VGGAFALAGAEEAPKPETVSFSGTTSRITVASPDETIVVNGQVMKIADFLAVLSSLDSSEEPRPRSPEKNNREKSSQTGPAQKEEKSCSGQTEASPPCVKAEPKRQDPETKHLP